MKRCLIALLLVFTLLLTACGANMTQEELLSLFQQDTVDLRDNVVPFEEMPYQRPNVQAIKAQIDKTTAMLSGNYTAEEVIDALDACHASYYTFYTMRTLAEIHCYQDLSDTAWAEEFDHCDTAVTQLEQLFDQLYIDCARSGLGAELEEQYFGEGFVDYYGTDYTGYTDETYASLVQQENDLLNQYRQLRAGLTVDYRGEETSYYDVIADPTLTDQEYTAAEAAYYEKYTPVFGELYIQLVQVRNELAAYCGYDSYGDYAFDTLYGRDYTAEEAETLTAEIRTYLAPVYRELAESGAWGEVFYDAMDEDGLEQRLSDAASQMGGEIAETWRFLQTNGLYDIRVSPQKVEMSFQDYLEDYEAPFAFVKTRGRSDDVLSFAHEFGHCVDAYVNYNDTYSLELSETFSQGMEYLLLCYLDGKVDQQELDNLTAMKLLDTLDVYAQQGSFADFEQQVYSLPEEALTVEAINEISLQTAKDYGYFEEGYEEYYAMSWIDISHFFEQPYYVISYCVSNDAAFQIYQMEREEAGSGLAVYNKILHWEDDAFLSTIEEQGGMESPFAESRMQSTAELIRNYFR